MNKDPIDSAFDSLDSSELLRLRSLAKKLGLKRRQRDDTAIPIISRDESLPLSYAQQRLWFLAQFDSVSSTYHIPVALDLRGKLNRVAWRRSLDRLIYRHEALRTVFVCPNGEPHVELLPPDCGFHLLEFDLASEKNPDERLRQILYEEAHAPFDLEHSPLIRGRLIRLADEEHVFLLTQHHIISDGWSIGVLTRELAALYQAFVADQPDPLPPLPLQYPDYAHWQRKWLSGQRLENQINYWRKTLADGPVLLELPTDRPRPAQQSFSGATISFRVDSELTLALKELSKRSDTTLFMTLLTAWAAVLGRLSGQEELVIGTPTANRNRTELEPLAGFFVNTLALRINLAGEPSFTDLLERVRQIAIEAQDHQDLPIEQVVEIVRPPRRLDCTPLFQVMFAWESNKPESAQLSGLNISPIAAPTDAVKFDIELTMSEVGDELAGLFNYSTALFDPSTIERQQTYFVKLLQGMVANPGQRVDRVELLTPVERKLALETWNQTDVSYPVELCFHELFEQQVERNPHAVAVVQDQVSLTYAQVNGLANRLALRLIEGGVKPDALVAVCSERRPHLVVALLAILKAGGAYLPLDPALPHQRLVDLLQDAQPSLILTDSVGRSALGNDVCYSYPGLSLDEVLKHEPVQLNPKVPELKSSHLAYVIYTSGSTGKPKGVLVEHRNALNLVCWTTEALKLGSESRVLQFASLSFDASVWELLMALGSGAALYLPNAQERQGGALLDYVSAKELTHALLPPALLQSNTEPERWAKALPTLILGGEAPSKELLKTLAPATTTLLNAYGPTEIAVCATLWRCPKDFDSGPISIGRPNANTRIYILDPQGRPVPVGVIGELYIGGAGVARGYLNRPELTRERFLPDPFFGRDELPLIRESRGKQVSDPTADEQELIPTEARMYRTGDLARYLPDGNIEFFGRNDSQVKLRGFRIELGEIETRLRQCAGIKEAAVIAREDVPGDKRLVAYFTTVSQDQAEADQGAFIGAVRTELATHLPEYMVPSAFVHLEALPLTVSGKLDRGALPTPDVSALLQRAYQPPEGDIEQTLATIWAELLNVERVGRNDHFFDLGGHSLLAVRLIAQIQQRLGVELPLATLFAHPILSGCAQAISDSGSESLPPIQPVPRNKPLALSFAQQRLWFLAQFEQTSSTYHIPIVLRFSGALNKAALRQSLERLIARHEALRSVFKVSNGQPQVDLLAADSGFKLIEEDFNPQDQQGLQELIRQETNAPFDLAQGPLIRGRLLQLSVQEHLFILTQHHIVTDGWSTGVFIRELNALYAAFVGAQAAEPLAPLPIQYPDYAAWQRQWLSGERLQSQVEYWRENLADAPVLLELPTDRPRPAEQSFNAASVPIQIGKELSAELKALSRRSGTTLFMTLLGAWAALLARLSSQAEVVIGTPSANRNRAELQDLIGFFVNTLALRVNLSGSPTGLELLERIRHTTLGAQQHQDLPFEQVVEIVQPPRRLDHSPLFQVMFSWQNNDYPALDLPGLEISVAGGALDQVRFYLELTLADDPSTGAISGVLSYSTALFDAATMERHCSYLLRVLEGIVQTPERPVEQIELLGVEEKSLLLSDWNRTESAYPKELCFHELFEQQVERNPQAVAVVQDQVSLTYAQLNGLANRLALQLIERGVKPDSLVAVCTERRPHLVVALLAILKAGGAYLPLDPALPHQRLVDLLQDAQPSLVLTDSIGRSALGQELCSSYPELSLDDVLTLEPVQLNPKVPELKSSHLAYVIYTSGSTGKPKGVLVEHRNALNLVCWTTEALKLGSESRVLQFASLSFDASVWELLMALGSGAALYLPTAQERQGGALLDYVSAKGLTHALLPPALLQSNTEPERWAKALPTLILGGEAPSRELLKTLAPATTTLLNAYGPTEIAVCATLWRCPKDFDSEPISIGRPNANTQIYILDPQGQPVPVGVIGELYIGGAGVARGYLNRPELTRERFLPDPFFGRDELPLIRERRGKQVSSRPADEQELIPTEERMYRTGDLARYLPDGHIEFLGRNDSQVKLRGFRIELGEIETRLRQCAGIKEAAVIAREDVPGDKRLVAYFTTVSQDQEEADQGAFIGAVRAELATHLPEYMVPSAFVHLEALPLTVSGKLDRKGLPAPDASALLQRTYEAPEGQIEEALAAIWAELLNVEQVGRNDHFFELGGHSLLAIELIDRVRRLGLNLEVRDLFTAPTLAALAGTLKEENAIPVPANLITGDTERITPELLPLIELEQSEIDRIVQRFPLNDIQDIYALSPLQEGILFHHLLATQGDPYLLMVQMTFKERSMLEPYLAALQEVINRHDILRTAFVWEGLRAPAQVVLRNAKLEVTEVQLEAHESAQELAQRFDPRHYRLDLTQAPLLRVVVAQEKSTNRWLAVVLLHHLVGDHSTLQLIHSEVLALLEGRAEHLPVPLPFRNLVAQARLGLSKEEHEAFFSSFLADIDEPTTPFGLSNVRHDGSRIEEAHLTLSASLNNRLRSQARRLGVSLASLCHLAWAAVVGSTSSRSQVVFGTVLFGRAQSAGLDRAMGLFINTLPIRLDLDQRPIKEALLHTHRLLAELLSHEHAPLALAQRASALAGGAPLFSALLNYRHNSSAASPKARVQEQTVEWLGGKERTNYPFALSIDDGGNTLGLTAQVLEPIAPQRVCEFMREALEELVDKLENAPETPTCELKILPPAERALLLETFCQTQSPYPAQSCIHELFEQQVQKTPKAIAVVQGDKSLTYSELNVLANQLAHKLIEQGVKPDSAVALCSERGPHLVVALLAIIKAGGAYVPLDPTYPAERLRDLLEDAQPVLILSDAAGRNALGEQPINLPHLTLDESVSLEKDSESSNPDPKALGLTSSHLAYVIYTSGSTGKPKGALNEHRAVVNRLHWMQQAYALTPADVVLQKTPFSFDVSVWEFFWTLLNGAKLVLAQPQAHKDPKALIELITSAQVSTLHFVPSMLNSFLATPGLESCISLRRIVCSGEALAPDSVRQCQRLLPESQLYNLYGPTEAAVDVTAWSCPKDFDGSIVPIGRPIANTQIYILDQQGQPVPLGVFGELYIGGAGVARGYLNRPELTRDRFLPDPFFGRDGLPLIRKSRYTAVSDRRADERELIPTARMYRTGDLARFLPDGNIEFLGRNDSQVKLRGFRIELGEIEARLRQCAGVKEAAVIAREDVPGDKRLVAYFTTGTQDDSLEPQDSSALITALRSELGTHLPDYMVPNAFVHLPALPLTVSGKLDRKALPAPDASALLRRVYEVPEGDIEQALAAIWAELLGLEQVGRNDHFFELGGHSLLAIELMERVRRLGLILEVRDLFSAPTLAALAATLKEGSGIPVPANLISQETERITPELLPLVELEQTEIDRIVEKFSLANIQDIYALSPLQEGILFHHLLAAQGDPYLMMVQMAFSDRAMLERYVAAIQEVINRHDILRTAFVWEGLPAPAQVVLRNAKLQVTEVQLQPHGGAQELAQRFDPRHYRLDLTQAPLLRLVTAQEPSSLANPMEDKSTGRWLVVLLLHHLIGDHSTLQLMHTEVVALLGGRAHQLPVPLPFRNLVAQARLGLSTQEHEAFFTSLLADIDEPTIPFGFDDVHHDGSQIEEAHLPLSASLNDRLRAQARQLGVSLASLCHLAWAQVVSSTSGRSQVVFGTVLFGRAQSAALDRAMGLFINTLPIRLDLDHRPLKEAVLHTHRLLAELLAHEHAPLALAQRASGLAGGAPLFSALLNYRHNHSGASPETTGHEQTVEWLGGQERTNYPFTLSVEDGGSTLGLTAQVLEPIAPQRVCEFMREALEELVDKLENAPQTPVCELRILPPAERELLLKSWNQTEAPYPKELCFHELFEQHVQRNPEAIAVVQDQGSLTYAQINGLANRLALQLIEQGVKPDSLVAVCTERRTHLVVALLAILKAGGAYLPLDPALPHQRLVDLLQDAQPSLVLTDSIGRGALGQELCSSYPELSLDDVLTLEPVQLNPKVPELKSSHLAYVIYTSGSTGKPKGVLVEHRNALNLVCWTTEALKLGSESRVLQFASLSFDASVWELLMGLGSGAALYLPTAQERQGDALLDYVSAKGLTHALLPPALLQSNTEPERWAKALPTLILGGEAPSRELLKTLAPATTSLLNAYGPTEIAVCATLWRCPKDFDSGPISIGRPNANTQIYILDPQGQPVPVGVIGELYIGGAGVARGYLNRPELTRERFLPDPFFGRDELPLIRESRGKQVSDPTPDERELIPTEGRMYRTGDLARYLPDGNIEFLGRNDGQVKLRGFRIELGEIETRLRQCSGIKEAAVIAREDVPGDKRLVAYFTTVSQDQGEADRGAFIGAVRAELATHLPEYMVPSAFVQLEALPLTVSGKLDRKGLPAPDATALLQRTYEAPEGQIEEALAAIWAELLNVEQVGRNDHFFDLGGHSLLAVRLIAQMQQKLGVELPLATLFSHPTLADCAQAISDLLSSSSAEWLPPIQRVSRDQPLALSFAQQRLWFLAQFEQTSSTYHIPIVLRFSGALDKTALRHSLDRLVARHEALRSLFKSSNGQPQVELLASDCGFSLIEEDINSEDQAGLQKLIIEETHAPFDLARGPLIRGRLLRLTDQEHLFVLTQHHIVTDFWSTGVFIRELTPLYLAAVEAQGAEPLTPLPIQYPDYAAWQRQWLSGERLQNQIDYWRDNLADAPVLLEVPTDRPRPAEQSFSAASVPIHIDKTLTAELKALSRRCGTSLFMTLLGAWAAVLARLSNQPEVVVGTPSANRNRAELQDLIGFFVNTLALRIDLSDAPTGLEFLERVRRTALGAQQHQDLPFEQVVEIVKPPRRLDYSPLFQVMFSWQNHDQLSLELPGLEVTVAGGSMDKVRFDLELTLADDSSSGTINGVLSYSTALFDAAAMERHCSYLLRLLEGLVQAPDRPVEQIELLDAQERALLLSDWNQTHVPFPKERCIHELFEEQVARTPEAIAVIQGEESLTYAQLNGLANRLAYQLIERGVKPGAYVAILLERGIPLVIAELAILKAGGAYVPLDPKLPSERQAWMISDCAAHLVITDRPAVLPEGDTPILVIEAISDNPGTHSAPKLRLSSEQIAYVMYTSGSTGIPKGVLVPHRAVNRLVINCGYAHFDATDRVAFASNPAFDATTMEVWAPLLNGGRIIVIDSDTSLDAQRLAQTLSRHEVTALFLTTALFNQHVLSIPSALARLKYLLCGGEREDPESFALLLRQGGPEHLIHCYGPTETTTFATTYEVPRFDKSVNRLPIGRPIANTTIYLLDEHGQPVPRGAKGELYIGGDGVALGYLNRPELTAERFLNDPFVSATDERELSPTGAQMYRTGDLARYLPDGNIEFLGRNDSQVKIRGFRIEPGEIEARLIQHPTVSEAVVIPREDSPGHKRLVAYLTIGQDAPQDLASVLRAHLSSALPEYMVPSAYVRMETFPLNANGKIDRKALPVPQDEAYVRQAYEAPEGKTEVALAQLWEELLAVEQVSRNDHFFELGGHSLLAVQMIARAQELGLKIGVNELFRNPILRELAETATGESDSSDPTRAIPARRTGNQRPLFFVPTGLGDPSYVFEMAKDLDPEIPVYALPWQSLEEPQLLSMQGMAARMVTMLQAIQPEGPYRLAGYSSGGILAYAIAEHLLGIDQAVEFLGFIDVKPPPAKGKEPTTARQMILDYIKNSEHPEVRSRIDLLSRLAADLSPAQFMQKIHELGLMPDQDPQTEAMSWEQKAIFDNAVNSYRATALPVIVHQFHATEITSSRAADDPETAKLIAEIRTQRNGSEIDSRILDWERILPVSSIQLVPVPGNHISMVAEGAHRRVLASRFSEILRSGARPSEAAGVAFNPLISLHAPRSSEFPLFCIPGAGANITTFSDFILALDGRLPVYGLQPRGIDALNPPHHSIEAAAACNLQRLAQLDASGPVHLLGHSHGAGVAIEMARRLEAEGRLVASLTLLDGEPPDRPELKVRDLSDRQIFEDFVSAIRLTFERPISIDEQLLASGQSELLLAQLHSQLLAAGVLPPRSRPSLLRGPLTTFAAARRTVYSPATPYTGKVRLVLVDDPALDAEANLKQRETYLSGWKGHVSDLELWDGPGNHYSMLRRPQVDALAKWWWDGLSRAAF